MSVIATTRPPRVGYLDYEYDGKRDGNIGGEVIYNLASKIDGIEVERCSADQVNQFEVVLVSIPSTSQVVDVFKLAQKNFWDKRRCKIAVGGFGVQNVNLLFPFIDYAFFGRMHDCVEDVIGACLGASVGGTIDGSVLSTASPNYVRYRQAPLMNVSGVFAEEFTGCPLKCKFCHYTYARKFEGKTNGYVQALLTGGGNEEVLYKDIPAITKKVGRLRTAIDGFSERIRYLYGKRISDDLITQGINHLGEIAQNKNQDDMFGGGELNAKTVMTVYNIANFPYETEADEMSLHEAVKRANPATRVIFILHSTPFRASPATPMQWERVQIFPDWSAKREHVICDRPNLLAKYSYTLEGPWSQLLAALVERSQPDDPVVKAAIAFRSGRSAERAERFMDQYDCLPYLGEHDIESDPPGAWYLKSYLTDEQMRKVARKMRAQRAHWS